MNRFDRGFQLNDDDCIDFQNCTMLRFSRLKSAIHNLGETIKEMLNKQGIQVPGRNCKTGHKEYLDIVRDGIPCQVLKINSQGWQKGKLKIKVSVEFYPDEPEEEKELSSPLDYIRQNMT